MASQSRCNTAFSIKRPYKQLFNVRSVRCSAYMHPSDYERLSFRLMQDRDTLEPHTAVADSYEPASEHVHYCAVIQREEIRRFLLVPSAHHQFAPAVTARTKGASQVRV